MLRSANVRNRLGLRSERGVALITVIVAAAALTTIASAALVYSRSDVLVSDNAKQGSTALWIAQLGNERAKNFLRDDGNWKDVTSATTLYAAGTTYPGIAGATYQTTVSPYGAVGGGKFLIDSSATAPDGASVRVQEVVAIPAANLSLDAINIQGIGTHTKLDENNIGIPKYFVDARNHDRNGVVCGADSVHCPAAATVAAIAGTSTVINNDVKAELGRLRQHMVNDASGCNSSGSNCSGPKEAGLYWIKKLSPQLTDANCNEGDPPPCYWNLDLTAVELNATSHPNNTAPTHPTHTTWADMFLGPYVGSPLTRVNDIDKDLELRNSITRILEFAALSEVGDRRAITTNLTTNQTYGTWDDPKIVITCDTGFNGDDVLSRDLVRRLSTEPPCNGVNAPNNLYVQNDAVITGTGILIVTRELELRDARFNWRGIVLILDEGRLQIKNGGNPDVRGMILGTVVVQDDSGANPKLKLAYLTVSNAMTNPFIGEPATSPAPPAVYGTTYGFGVKFSTEAIENALTAGVVTLAWHEVYEGEEPL